MKKIIERLKSPVVILQIISIIVTVIIYFIPEIEEQVKVISTAISAILSLFAGLNNPDNKNEF